MKPYIKITFCNTTAVIRLGLVPLSYSEGIKLMNDKLVCCTLQKIPVTIEWYFAEEQKNAVTRTS